MLHAYVHVIACHCLERTGYVFCETLVDHVLAIIVMGNTCTNHDLSCVSSVICGHWCWDSVSIHASKKNSYYASVYMMPTFVIKNTVGEHSRICVNYVCSCTYSLHVFFNIIFMDLFHVMPTRAMHAHTHNIGALRTPSCSAFWKIPLRSRKLATSSGRTRTFSAQMEHIFGVSHGFSALLPLLSSQIHSLFPFSLLSVFEAKRMLA